MASPEPYEIEEALRSPSRAVTFLRKYPNTTDARIFASVARSSEASAQLLKACWNTLPAQHRTALIDSVARDISETTSLLASHYPQIQDPKLLNVVLRESWSAGRVFAAQPQLRNSPWRDRFIQVIAQNPVTAAEVLARCPDLSSDTRLTDAVKRGSKK